MFDPSSLLRSHLRTLVPYSSARDEFSGTANIFLDANENAYGSVTKKAYNRYPDPYQQEVKDKIAVLKGVPSEMIFLGNGSDEPIDLLLRAFCEPNSEDQAIIMPPTYGMYQVSANINNVNIIKVPLTRDFQIDLPGVIGRVNRHTKLIFICSPNNPTGNLLSREDILKILTSTQGLVIVDEAYIDFAEQESFIKDLDKYPNLIVLQTFSKSWGLAAIRLGMAYADRRIISILNQIKYPYNLSQQTQDLALEALNNAQDMEKKVQKILHQKSQLVRILSKFDIIEKIYPSDANFVLVKVPQARSLYDYLLAKGIIIRDRSKVTLCEGCLRISIGTSAENKELLDGIKDYTELEKTIEKP